MTHFKESEPLTLLKAGDTLEIMDGTKHLAVADDVPSNFECGSKCSIFNEDCCPLIHCDRNKPMFHFELQKP